MTLIILEKRSERMTLILHTSSWSRPKSNGTEFSKYFFPVPSFQKNSMESIEHN
jgi:hypothetical protein